MDEPGTYELVGRLAVAVFVIVTPTLLFLGLVRALERLRDDDLINEWARSQGHDRDLTDHDDVFGVLAAGVVIGSDRSSSVRCPACGVTNRTDMRYCQECLSRLPS